jgi:hypothetical protein
MQPDIIPHPAKSAAKQTPTRTLCIAIMKTLPSRAGAFIARHDPCAQWRKNRAIFRQLLPDELRKRNSSGNFLHCKAASSRNAAASRADTSG